MEYVMVDCHDREITIKDRAQKAVQNQATGRLRGGMNTKALAACDALGNLAKLVPMPNQRHDGEWSGGIGRRP